MAKLKFICEFEVDETWVADGFNPDDEDAHSMIAHRLPHAMGGEIKGRVLVPIDQEKAAKLMGYVSLRAMNAVRKKEGNKPIKGREFAGTYVQLTCGPAQAKPISQRKYRKELKVKPPVGKLSKWCLCKRRTHEASCPLAGDRI